MTGGNCFKPARVASSSIRASTCAVALVMSCWSRRSTTTLCVRGHCVCPLQNEPDCPSVLFVVWIIQKIFQRFHGGWRQTPQPSIRLLRQRSLDLGVGVQPRAITLSDFVLLSGVP